MGVMRQTDRQTASQPASQTDRQTDRQTRVDAIVVGINDVDAVFAENFFLVKLDLVVSALSVRIREKEGQRDRETERQRDIDRS
jgi:hypothetical protein